MGVYAVDCDEFYLNFSKLCYVCMYVCYTILYVEHCAVKVGGISVSPSSCSNVRRHVYSCMWSSDVAVLLTTDLRTENHVISWQHRNKVSYNIHICKHNIIC